MASWLVTGRIIPERKTFGHKSLPPLHVKDPDSGLDVRVTFCVIDNQLLATIVGQVGDQSNVKLKEIVTQAEQLVLNAATFVSGAVFDVDVISVVRQDNDAPAGSIRLHYMNNMHDVISGRRPAFGVTQIWQLCQG